MNRMCQKVLMLQLLLSATTALYIVFKTTLYRQEMSQAVVFKKTSTDTEQNATMAFDEHLWTGQNLSTFTKQVKNNLDFAEIA